MVLSRIMVSSMAPRSLLSHSDMPFPAWAAIVLHHREFLNHLGLRRWPAIQGQVFAAITSGRTRPPGIGHGASYFLLLLALRNSERACVIHVLCIWRAAWRYGGIGPPSPLALGLTLYSRQAVSLGGIIAPFRALRLNNRHAGPSGSNARTEPWSAGRNF